MKVPDEASFLPLCNVTIHIRYFSIVCTLTTLSYKESFK